MTITENVLATIAESKHSNHFSQAILSQIAYFTDQLEGKVLSDEYFVSVNEDWIEGTPIGDEPGCYTVYNINILLKHWFGKIELTYNTYGGVSVCNLDESDDVMCHYTTCFYGDGLNDDVIDDILSHFV